MNKNIAAISISFLVLNNINPSSAQDADSTKSNFSYNTANAIVYSEDTTKKLSIGAYAQLEYSKQFGDTLRHNAFLDVHRLVVFMGYKFNSRTHFVSEIEFEHVNEAAVEQAFLNYRLTRFMDVRAGLILIPMGIINEYHEPTTFNGVLRPNVDKKIVPATWRELGAGLTGKIDRSSLRYQIYLVNGFNGYDGAGNFRGDDALRGGRQEGGESYMTAPDFSCKLDYYGIRGLKMGAAAYLGESESTVFEGVPEGGSKTADSSVVGITMFGFDARYEYKGFEARAEFITAQLSNTQQYNAFTSEDLGSGLSGYYAEAGYNVLQHSRKTKNKLVLFARYENYNTHASVKGMTKNKAYNRTDITIGIGFKVADGAVFKADYQNMSDERSGPDPRNMFNLGIGVWF